MGHDLSNQVKHEACIISYNKYLEVKFNYGRKEYSYDIVLTFELAYLPTQYTSMQPIRSVVII